ncbi:MAG: OmpA family protein, partial [Myxococcota bacterium]
EDEDGCPDEGLIEMRNDRIVLEETVLFDFQRARVKRRARPIVDAIVALVRQHPDWMKMRIEGHADVRGDQAYNQELSERRARNVERALVAAGLPEDLLESVGFGSSRPRDLRRSEEAHARNRRVEFVLVARRNADGSVTGTREVIDMPSALGAAAAVDADMVIAEDPGTQPVAQDGEPEAELTPDDGTEPEEAAEAPADGMEPEDATPEGAELPEDDE